ncbi:uncharacterized protein LOC133563715 isoform X1 [Nerophis ophidion]|uniref:uncharacterized protein LOC133563715 isoform X1 n=1 Tax=Nerophis ophidion TaxID=159077 RepID=UPI002AE0641D|nr:uncharacterized protein LOC133563715 isoform X1 [Nerophis ophidion]XP_061773985.1 uncharacterized protein LOC133563715 isoform X1 [Nerophis ophidion]XP_061773986.1 uncharacterized protein LOC133563715 isoform X1 [Nerophis ophidion]XP_061773987.1 uncharacterized protein LOC133563715 isoform X1 [Nerophis ophidion]XP_061773988.1 uncharacterized protein LOC133563715 isoform X1 [Nerophis ophidion]XP_061773989.1 uncharacterized protein LOC133563715 isoform X1 [Nerophis ophidion]XP_061773990.1 un
MSQPPKRDTTPVIIESPRRSDRSNSSTSSIQRVDAEPQQEHNCKLQETVLMMKHKGDGSKMQEFHAEKDNKKPHAKTCDGCKVNFLANENEAVSAFQEAKCRTPLNPNVMPFLPQTVSPLQPFSRFQDSSLSMSSPRVPPIPTFNGRMSSFSFTNRKPLAAQYIVDLNDYSIGDARHATKTYFRRDKEDSWNEERKGNFIVERAFREKLRRWPKIRDNDPLALKVFADFLKSCSEAIPRDEELAFLNSCEENHKLLEKLPEWMINKWSQIAVDKLDNCGEYPNFAFFMEFLSKEAQVVCYANALPSLPNSEALGGQPLRKKAPQTNNPNLNKEIAPSTKLISVCCVCKKNDHDIARCPVFAAKTPECKKAFIYGNGMCFGCLKKGHFIKECKGRHICSTCHRHHPTSLHSNRIPKASPSPLKNDFTPTDSLRSQDVPHSTRRPSATSSIIPVFVSAMVEPDKEVLTYAILDAQSSSTFILEDVLDKLNVGCQSVKLKLSTMTATDTIIASKNVQDLKVRGLNLDSHIEIKQAYARGFIPMNKCQIPTSRTALQWPHLEHLADKLPPFQDCNVGLLIGYDCPSALAPLEVIIGAKNEPFAQRTQLGWSIIGPSNPDFDRQSRKSDSLVTVHQSKDTM